MNNTKKLIVLCLFDLIMGILFVSSNIWIWERLNGNLAVSTWGPLQMGIVPKTIAGGQAETVGTFSLVPNYPFILFWVAIVGNLIFVVFALRQKKGQP